MLLALLTTSCIENESCMRDALVQEYEQTTLATKYESSKKNKGGGDLEILGGSGEESDPYIIDLSGMTDNIKIDAGGAHQVNEWYETISDVNLNGKKLDIHHISLVVNGNLNGNGKLKVKNHTELCVTGVIQNNVNQEVHNEVFLFTQGQECSSSTLSTQTLLVSSYEKKVNCDECGDTFITNEI